MSSSTSASSLNWTNPSTPNQLRGQFGSADRRDLRMGVTAFGLLDHETHLVDASGAAETASAR
jgi:hypothetical protein